MQGVRWQCAGRGARSDAGEVPPCEEQHGHCLHAMGEHLLAPDTPRYCMIPTHLILSGLSKRQQEATDT